MKEGGTIIWNITGGCNLDCPYCLEGHNKPDHPTKNQLELRVNNLLQSIKGVWELRLNGGEVFDMPNFLDYFIPTIINNSKHKVAVLTNLTCSLEEVLTLSELTKDRLSFFSSSLHLVTRKKDSKEIIHTDPFEYLEKAKKVKEIINKNSPGINYYVNCVLLPSKLNLIKSFKPIYDKAGIPLFFQFLKIGVSPNLEPFKYEQEQLGLIKELTGREITENDLVNAAKTYKGRTCYAGKKYFIINEEGLAYICHGALGNKKHLLGNITETKLALRKKPVKCPYDLCTASIPKIKGIIQ